MESNLATKFRRPKNQSIRTVTVWTNSAVVLCWLRDEGNYNVFVYENCIIKILSNNESIE